jgi:peptidoglycan/LPS O-acetylase OafA/YrhL
VEIRPDLPSIGVDEHRAAFVSKRIYSSLDGLRSISILAVIWAHGPGQIAAWPLLRSGRFGVNLFFAISGFLITSLLLRERDSNGNISLQRFYARRSLRIFPLYYVIFLVYLVGVLMRPLTPESQQFLNNVKYFLTYTSNWFVNYTAIFAFTWSLATEEQFYCVWPSAEKLLGKYSPVAMGAIIALLIAVQRDWVQLSGFPRIVAVNIAFSICSGVLLAHLLHHRLGFRAAFRFIGFPGAPLAAFALTGIALSLRANPLVVDICMVLIVAACVIREDHWFRPILTFRPIALIGTVSYGMYLFHGLVYNALGAIPMGLARHGIPLFLLAVGMTYLVAAFSYRYYESFFLKLKLRFEAPRLKQVAQAAARRGSGPK